MEEKNRLVINYINNIKNEFEKNGNPIPNETVTNVTSRYINSSKTFEEIKKEIDKMVEEKLEEIRKRLEFLEKMQREAKNIQNLNLDSMGITLNEQDIDLMMIANAKTLDELQKALKKITNISLEIPNVQMEDEQFKSLRQQVYNLYMKSLTSINKYYSDPKIKKYKKVEYLRKSGIFDSKELQKFDTILKNGNIDQNGNVNQILNDLNNAFSKEKMHQILQTLKDYSPIENPGIIGTEIETYQKMFQEMNNKYNSITIDEAAKYGNVALLDGTFDFSHLQKTLDFAKANGHQVRLNTLLFYMDCPDNLYNLPVTEENKERVKQVLSNYVEQITSFIRDNGYDSTIRSIDVFNELLNRFALSGNIPYKYRGDILQDPNVEDFDNIKSGWLKFLNVEDLCDVISIARKNLKYTDFMYNDDNLIDPRKIPATTEILKKIRHYEITHDIRLIDSIGTQMHIDNDVTKEQIINMFNTLRQYGLPIEITEFDLAMTSNVEGLSKKEINDLRIQKMNDFYEAVNECREKDNIRGFTIWSKTDAQNFRVALENKKRIENGQEPISTLYGGFYNNDMTDKKSKTKVQFQNFNYHTHTYRSGHYSEYTSDEEILEAAKLANISMLGFSEHIPNPDLEYPDEDHRMLLSEVDGYIASINKMKQDNPDMTILAGFEAEFDPMKESFLGEMREKVDYMILGQHFIKNNMQMVERECNPNYPLAYAKMVCKGIESGLFDIVAHPDCFMEFRDTISDENKASFESNCIKASHMICQKAAEMGIPIEINLGNALNNQFLNDGNLGIPHPLFWQIAKDYDVKVLKGIDAHSLSAFKNIDKGQELITNIEEMVSDKMIKGPYNPVIARKNNQKLQEAYKLHQERALTYETHMISHIVNNTLTNVGDELDSESLAETVENSLNGAMKECVGKAGEKDESTIDEISKITASPELSTKDKKAKLERKKQVVNETNQVLANQQKAIENAKNNVVNAMNMGCENKKEYSSVITQMSQHQSTKSKVQKSIIEQNISNFQQSKVEQKTNSQSKNKPKVLKKINNNNNHNHTSTSGFVNMITLALIISFASGALFMIVYMLIKG